MSETLESNLLKKYRYLLHPGFSTPVSKWTYDVTKSYDWNYEHGPNFNGIFPQRNIKPSKKFLNFNVNSLFGVPAGPLFNSSWVELYSKLGFDILTYKTVRTRSYVAYPKPHMIFLDKKDREYIGKAYSSKYDPVSMTNSFGIPSKDPDVWQEDIVRSLKLLKKGQLLIIGILATQEDAKNEEEFIQDYVKCAVLVTETKAPVIEVNLSCPNLHASEIVCYDSNLSARICEGIKNAIGDIPLLAKICYFENKEKLKEFVLKTHEFVEGYTAINTLRTDLIDKQYKTLAMRSLTSAGMCGALLRPYGLSMVEELDKLRKELNVKYSIIGVGGVTTPEDYELYMQAGADAVQSGTGAMMDPYLAYKIYKKESQEKATYKLVKSFGAENFENLTQLHSLNQLKNIYMDFLFDPKDHDNILQISNKPYELKHGERGRKTSHIYLNHRKKLFTDLWDRKLLAKVVDKLIRTKLKDAKNGYGVIATTTSASPELTAQLFEDFKDIKRLVILNDEVIRKEKGTHSKIYGQLDPKIPWIIFDDVFTTGNTFKETLRILKKGKIDLKSINIVVLTLRGEENLKIFEKETKKKLIYLTTLNEILKFHFKDLSNEEKSLILNERKELKD